MAAVRGRTGTGDVPVELTSFVGREREIRNAVGQLELGNPLTLLGPGGVGKTRLAARVVRALQRLDPRLRVRWTTLIGLDAAGGAAAVERTVAEALGVEIITERSAWNLLVDHLAEQVATGGDMVLVLDNCEHVVGPVGRFVGALRTTVPEVRILATSREPLACAGERLFVVPPLSQPADTETDAGRTESVELLVERAAAGGVAIGADDRDLAVQLCRRLDGLPLAIELAAAALRSQSLPEVVSRIGDSPFGLLAGGPRHGAHPMHSSLRSAVDWSFRFCGAAERLLWARLSVFENGWDLAAAEAVGAGPGLERIDVLAVLGRLVDKSIVIADTSGPRTRYRLLETLRQYGHDLAAERDEVASIRRRHRDHYLATARRAAEDWYSPRELDWLDWARRELANLRAAWTWSAATDGEASIGLELAVWLARLRLHFFLGNSGEVLGWLEAGLAATAPDGPAELRVQALALAGVTALCQGAVELATELLAQCRLEAQPDAAPLLQLEGLHLFYAAGDPRSVEVLDGAVEAFTAAGDRFRGDRSMALLFSAMAAAWYGTPQQAFARTQQFLDETACQGAGWAAAWAELVRGIAVIWQGDPRDARCAERRPRELGDQWGIMYGTHMAAWAIARTVARRRGADPGADRSDALQLARTLGGAARLRERYRVSMTALVPFADASAAAERIAVAVLGRDGYAAAFAAGHQLSFDEILALLHDGPIVQETGGSSADSALWDGLTGTEKEVALLAAQALTDLQIARRRMCSVRTVEKHLENVRRKLMIASRTEIARWIPAGATPRPDRRGAAAVRGR